MPIKKIKNETDDLQFYRFKSKCIPDDNHSDLIRISLSSFQNDKN